MGDVVADDPVELRAMARHLRRLAADLDARAHRVDGGPRRVFPDSGPWVCAECRRRRTTMERVLLGGQEFCPQCASELWPDI